MSLLLFTDFSQTQLAGGITNIATTANLLSGAGATLPSPSNGQYFVMEFNDQATGDLYEIVHVTNVTVDTITMVRGQEGTTAIAWSAGDLVFSGPTAGQQEVFQQSLSYNGDPNGHVAGTAGSSTYPPTLCWNSAAGLFYYCSQTGNAAGAVWQPLLSEPFLADTGSGNGIVISFPSAPSTLTELLDVPFYTQKAASANTGATTINPNSLGAVPVVLPGGHALVGGEIPSGADFLSVYNGTSFQLLGLTGITPRMQNGTGNPNGSVAGVAGLDLYVDTASLQLWTCTTTGTTSTAVWATPPSPAAASSTGSFTLASPQTLSNATTTQIDLSGSALAFATVAAGGTVTITETGLYSLDLNDIGQLTITGTASYGFISQIIVGGVTVAQPWYGGYDSNTTHNAGNSSSATLYIPSGTTISATAFLGNGSFGGFSALTVQSASLTITKLA